MSNNVKVKFYKNPSRNSAERFKPYVPQYQIMGIEPADKTSPSIPPSETILVSKMPIDNNNTKTRGMIRQPYAEAVESPIGVGRGLLPNVGNNMEQTWSSVDGEVVDDVGLNSDTEFVDNNEMVSDAALGIDADVQPANFLSEGQLQEALTDSYLQTILSKMEEDEYLLLLNDQVICSGPQSYVEEQTASLVFGEHELFMGTSISIDNILVIKKVPIKVGVFLK